MSKPLSHQLDVYGVWIHLARTRAEWSQVRRTLKALDRYPGDAAGTTTHAEVAHPGGRKVSHWVVFVNVGAALNQLDMLDTVAHEASHVAAGLIEHVGDKAGDTEALAYLVGWVTTWLWRGCTES